MPYRLSIADPVIRNTAIKELSKNAMILRR